MTKESAMIKIEKNVPLRKRNGLNQKYPFDQMEIGDSFFVQGGHVNIASGGTARCRPKRFISRKEEKGYRIWRVA